MDGMGIKLAIIFGQFHDVLCAFLAVDFFLNLHKSGPTPLHFPRGPNKSLIRYPRPLTSSPASSGLMFDLYFFWGSSDTELRFGLWISTVSNN